MTKNDIPLPPEPILIRWETWINVTIYYCEHLENIQSVIKIFNSDDAVSIKTVKKYLEK
jgi:hypothetical protein